MPKNRFLHEIVFCAYIQWQGQFAVLYSKGYTSDGSDYPSTETKMRCDMVELERSETERFED